MNQISTRLLMSCAAIGVAGGVVFAVNAWAGGTLAHVIPLAYGLTIGLYFIPGALAQALFRRPWTGLLTSALSGLIASPFQPIFFGAFLISLAIGALQELPFLITRYRIWRWWLFLIGSMCSGAVMTGAVFQVLGDGYSPAGIAIMVSCFFLSPPACTMFAMWLAERLAAAGVGRSLRAPATQPERTGRPGTPAP